MIINLISGKTTVATGYTLTVKYCGSNAYVQLRNEKKVIDTYADPYGTAIFENVPRGPWLLTSSIVEEIKAIYVDKDMTVFLFPLEYTPVEYICSTAKEAINTNINGDCVIEVGFAIEAATTNYGAIAYIENGGSPYNGRGIRARITNNQLTLHTSSNGAITATTPIELHARCDVELTMSPSYGKSVVNNVLVYEQNATGGMPNNNTHYHLFCGNTSETSRTQYSTATLYYANIYSGIDKSELVRNYVPCKREADGVYGLYDFISNTFTGSVTSTQFTIAGPEIADEFSEMAVVGYVTDQNTEVLAYKEAKIIQGIRVPCGDQVCHVFPIAPIDFGLITFQAGDNIDSIMISEPCHRILRQQRVLYDKGNLFGNRWMIQQHNKTPVDASSMDTSLYVSSSGGGSVQLANCFYINDPIDFKPYKYIGVHVLQVSNIPLARIFITPTAEASNQAYYYLASNLNKIIAQRMFDNPLHEDGIVVMDIQDLDISAYLTIGLRAASANAAATIEIDKVWLYR